MRYKIKCIFIVGGRERERVQTRVSKFFWVTHSHFQGYYYYLFIYLISLLRFRVAINSHAKAAQALLCPQHSQPSQASLLQPFPPVSVGDVCFLQIIVHSFRHLPPTAPSIHLYILREWFFLWLLLLLLLSLFLLLLPPNDNMARYNNCFRGNPLQCVNEGEVEYVVWWVSKELWCCYWGPSCSVRAELIISSDYDAWVCMFCLWLLRPPSLS